MLDQILDVLKQLNLNQSRIYGRYDGASNMSSEFKRLQQKLRKTGTKQAIFVHCYARRLNLVIVEMSKSVPIIARFFANDHALSIIVGASAKRQNFFAAAQSAKIATDTLESICGVGDDESDDDDDDDVVANAGIKRKSGGKRHCQPQSPNKRSSQLLRPRFQARASGGARFSQFTQ